MAAKDEDGNVNDDGKESSNHLLSQETSNEQGTSNQPAISNVPVSLGEAVPLSSQPSSSRMISPSGPSMAEVVKMSLEENVTKAPAVKNDPSLHDKSSAATKPSSSNASTESDAHAILREQLGDSDGNLVEPGEMDELLQEISDALLLSQGSMDVAMKRRYALIIKERSATKAPVKNDRPLPDHEDVTNSIGYPSTEYDEIRGLSKIDPSSSDHLEAEHVQYGTHGPVNQPMPTRQSITTTASSSGRRPPISMTQAFITSTEFVPQSRRNQQAMNPHYSQSQAPSGQYGNITNSPYSPPSAATFQQPGGSNNNTLAHYGNITNSPYWRAPEQNVSYNTPHSASIVPYAYGSANLSGTWSDNNPANSRFGYEAGVSTNNLPSIQQQQHQGGDLNAWRPNEQHRQFWDDICASSNPQNDRSGPSDQTRQRSPPRDN